MTKTKDGGQLNFISKLRILADVCLSNLLDCNYLSNQAGYLPAARRAHPTRSLKTFPQKARAGW